MQSARVGGPLEGVASSSSRENRLEVLGSVCWSLSPVPCSPSNPPFTSRVSSCLCPFLSLELSPLASTPSFHLVSLGEKPAGSHF